MSEFTDLVGTTLSSYRFCVEEGKIAEFARAVQAENPLYRDASAARDAGLAGILAPPTFSTASAHWTPAETSSALKLDLKRVLAGGGEWEYLHPVVAGDELIATTIVESVEEKQGKRGPMTVIRLRVDYVRDDELVQTYTSSIIQFGVVEEEK